MERMKLQLLIRLSFCYSVLIQQLYPDGRFNPAMLDLFQYYQAELREKGFETPWLMDIEKLYRLKDFPGCGRMRGDRCYYYNVFF